MLAKCPKIGKSPKMAVFITFETIMAMFLRSQSYDFFAIAPTAAPFGVE